MGNDKENITDLFTKVIEENYEDKAETPSTVNHFGGHAMQNNAETIINHNHYGSNVTADIKTNPSYKNKLESSSAPITAKALRCHKDNSVAEHPKQSKLRKVLKPRKIHSRIKEVHMTPKEYKAYMSVDLDGEPLWDGIERRHGAFDYSAWDWKRKALLEDSLDAVKDRRNFTDRRVMKHIAIAGDKRRLPLGQREADLDSWTLHRIFLYTIGFVIAVMAYFAVLDFKARDSFNVLGVEVKK